MLPLLCLRRFLSVRATLRKNTLDISRALVNACHAFSEFFTKLRSCSLSSSASGVPDVFTNISESSAESQRLTHAQVRKRCKKVPRFSRPRNSGTVEGINIPILVDGDGGPSQVYVFCTPTAVGTASCVSSALEPDIAPETVVFSRRPLKTLLEHPPTRTTFYMQCRLRKVD